MEAPEKIYLNPIQDALTDMLSEKTDGDIEYIRTDAFIEKAEEFLYEKLNSGEMECGDIAVFIEKFRNYMKR